MGETFGYFMKDLGIKMGMSTVFVAGAALSWVSPDLIFRTSRVEKNKLLEQISLVADVDRKNGTTHNEWADVYGEIGLHYDVHDSSPREDLSIKQMRTYLSNHSQSLSQ